MAECAQRRRQIVSIGSPVAVRSGELLTGFEHAGEWRHVVAFEFMPGTEPDENVDLEKMVRASRVKSPRVCTAT